MAFDIKKAREEASNLHVNITETPEDLSGLDDSLSNELLRIRSSLESLPYREILKSYPEGVSLIEKILALEFPSAKDDAWEEIEDGFAPIDALITVSPDHLDAGKCKESLLFCAIMLRKKLSESDGENGNNKDLKKLLILIEFLIGKSNKAGRYISKMIEYKDKMRRHLAAKANSRT